MKKRELNVTPSKTEDGMIYLSWDLIAAIREDGKWCNLVLEIAEITFPHPHIATALVHLKDKGEVVASAAAAFEWNDEIDGKPAGSRYVGAAVTKAKGLVLSDYFGLKNEYNEPKPVASNLANEVMASIEKKLNEQNTKRSDSQEPVPGI